MAKIYPYTRKTREFLEEHGWKVCSVERYHGGVRRDLFGIIDIIAIAKGQIVGVQSSSFKQRRPHLKKIMGECRTNTEEWLRTPGQLWLVTWKAVTRGGNKPVKDTKKNNIKYIPVVDVFTLDGGEIHHHPLGQD